MKKIKLLFTLFACLLSLNIMAQNPTIVMDSVVNITSHKAKFYGKLSNLGSWTKSSKVGFMYAPVNATKSTDTVKYFKSQTKTGQFNYQTATETYYLKPNTQYWIKALATKTSPNDTVYSQPITFTTAQATYPSVTLNDATNIGLTSVTLTGTIDAKGDAEKINGYGFIISTIPNPTKYSSSYDTVRLGTSATTFPTVLSNSFSSLQSGATYYYRIWTSNVYTKYYNDTVYSEQKTFVTPHACGSVPKNVDTISVGIHEATLTWQPGLGQVKFEVEYGLAGHTLGEGNTVIVNGTSVQLTGLQSNKSYSVFVRAICENMYSDWSDLRTFRTKESPCEDVSGVHVDNLTHISARILWTPGAMSQNKWEVLLAKVTEPYPSTPFTVEGEAIYFPLGLTSQTEYKVKVRAVCATDNSSWSDDCTFTTYLNDLDEEINQAYQIKIYPNPSNDVVYFEGNKYNVDKIEVYSQLGSLVYNSNELPDKLNLKNFGSGTYTIHIMTIKGIQVEKIIIQ